MDLPGKEEVQKITALLNEAQAVRVNNLQQSIILGTSALELSIAYNDKHLTAKSRSALSFFYMINGESERSLAIAAEASDYYEAVNDEKGLANVKYTIASVYYKTDNLHAGLVYLTQCLATYRKYNDHISLAKSYKALGTIYEYFGDTENAIEAYEASINDAKAVGDINMKTNAYNPLSGIYLNQGRINEAMEMIQSSITLKQQTGDTRGLAFAYYGRGKIYTRTREYDLAEKDLDQSIAIHTAMGEKLGLCMSIQKKGVLFLEQGKYEQAKEQLLKAKELSENCNSRMLKTRTCYLLYQVFKKQQNAVEALRYLEIHHAEQEANVHNQTHQIVNNYKLISRMEAKALEDKMQLERVEMTEKKNKAEYKAKAKQDFLSNMSHEIRTPLNAVITITNLLKERADEEDQQLLESLRFASNNLLLLINDILDFTKLDTGKVVLEKQPVNIRNLLQNIKNTYDGLAIEKGLQLSLHTGEEAGTVYELDEMRLTQILGNLLSNAIKFTEKGCVALSVEKICEKEEGIQLRFSIADTGIGITEDFLSEIFDAFTQPKSVTTKKQGGSGLGLAIVKKLAALYGSEIYIQSKPDEGSVFTFELVLKPGILPQAAPVKENPRLNSLNVLLAEDNNINTLVVTKLLQRWGIKADFAKNGIEAVEKSTLKKYDIVLMDIHMPEMNGYDATIKIKQEGNINCNTPIYALTADINANLQQEYTSYFNGFLHKPIEVNQLYGVLNNISCIIDSA
jgi:signal transduction histidine kinase/CheY-like chemotaxis protein